jgi:hypothetical protein
MWLQIDYQPPEAIAPIPLMNFDHQKPATV